MVLQLVGTDDTKLAVAPRVSLLLPTVDHRFGRGSGGLGLQTNLRVSIQHSAHQVSHWNAGATWIQVRSMIAGSQPIPWDSTLVNLCQRTLDLTGCQRKRTHWRRPQREGFGGAARGRTIRWHPQHLTRFTPLLPRDAIYNRPTLDELPAGAERAAKGRRWRMAQAQQGRGLPYKPSTEGQLRNPAGRTARRGVLSPEV